MTDKATKAPAGKAASNDPANNQKLLELMAKLMAENQKRAAEVQAAEAAKADPRSSHKPIEEYKFWKTQPVEKFEAEPVKQGPLETKTVDDVAKEAQKLPEGFEWCTVDLNDEAELQELYDLLYANYIEDDDEQFRFKYSSPFLKWAMTPPGWNREFSAGIRATDSKKLLAFIDGIPADLVVRGTTTPAVEINFLCVHKKLRSKRLAPVLIREITRRVNLTGVWQALFTAGTVIPTPVATARYYHRVINWTKLYEVGFAYLPEDSTPAQQVARTAIAPSINVPGFRPMEKRDVPHVQSLLSGYLSKFDLHQKFTEKDVEHYFLPPPNTSHLYSYVVETSGQITDFISFYGLESTVLGSPKHESIKVAYSYYYATVLTGERDLGPRLEQLFKAVLIEAKSHGYDVLNALTVLDNPLILDSLKFSMGDGFLNYNLFNWLTPPISGGLEKDRKTVKPGGVGVVLL